MVVDYRLIEFYAKALLSLSLDKNEYSRCLALLTCLIPAIEDEKIDILMADPRAKSKEKLLSLLKKICYKESSGYFWNLLKILIEKNQLIWLSKIKIKYEELYLEYKNKVVVVVLSAHPMKEEQRERLKRVLEKKLCSKVVLRYRIDKKLIGGLLLQIGNDVIDGSVLGKLENLRAQFV